MDERLDGRKMKKFVLSFSSGKDSTLALDKLIQEGNQPTGLVTSFNEEIDYSWFHGIPPQILEKVADSIGITLVRVPNTAETYQERMELAMQEMKQQGALFCAFGDIDIEQNAKWNTHLAEQAGMDAVMPLWQVPRAEVVKQFLDRGYTAMIKTISKASGIPTSFLGKPLNQEFIDYLEANDLDVCGENGEYHTLVVDGPLFSYPISYNTHDIHESEYAYSLIIS